MRNGGILPSHLFMESSSFCQEFLSNHPGVLVGLSPLPVTEGLYLEVQDTVGNWLYVGL